MKSGESEFSIVVDVRSVAVGNYYLAFYAGLSGSYTREFVYRVGREGGELGVSGDGPDSPTGCAIGLEENSLVVRWDEDGRTPLERITFIQGDQTVEYILSNFQSSFIIPHKDFANFQPGYVTVEIASAYSSTISATGRISQFSVSPWSTVFKAGYHAFDSINSGVTFGQ